jgi:hypothetical protein
MEHPSRGEGPLHCKMCVFWEAINATLGTCRRYAPRPIDVKEAVAHWAETRADEGCGDGEPRGGRPAMVACADCVYWMRPGASGGLAPMDFVDQPRAWWRGAGRCARRAPRAGLDPGARRVWQATHGTDACGEGVARAPVSAGEGAT